MQVGINLFVVKVRIDDSMDVHEVLDDGVAEGQRRSDLRAAVAPIGHLETKLAHAVYSIGGLLVILVKHAECMILPVKCF